MWHEGETEGEIMPRMIAREGKRSGTVDRGGDREKSW